MIEKPPYAITTNILSLVERIGEAIGRAEAAGVSRDARLRRNNRIRTIRGSLAIEGNTLSEEEIAAILDGKPVAAPPRDIQEALRVSGVSDQVSDQVAQLVAALGTEAKSAAELMEIMGLSHRPTFRKNYLRPSMSAGLVEMTRPESPTAKNQKYRLTIRGRGMLEGLTGGQ